jgi:putative ribosome biogenesis GTPase RsgA
VSLAPCFAIRKPATTTFRLQDYVKAQIATPAVAKFLAEAVANGRNILVAGGTGSGKTTLANALLAEVAVHGLERDDVLAVGQHHASDGDLVHLTDGFANNREGPTFPSGTR